jgi:hypothetical protein
MKVGIDIDDVLFPWYEKAHAACVAAGVTNGVEPSTWSPADEYGCSLDEWYAILERVTLDGTLYSGDPYPNAIESLERLHAAGHSIHLVTARGFLAHGHLIRSQTVQWLADYSVPHDTLTFSKDKTVVAVDVFADDSEKNLRELLAAGVACCLIDAPHNRHVEHDYRLAGIAEFVTDILERHAA